VAVTAKMNELQFSEALAVENRETSGSKLNVKVEHIGLATYL
jgi:hypothetical protein